MNSLDILACVLLALGVAWFLKQCWTAYRFNRRAARIEQQRAVESKFLLEHVQVVWRP